MRRAIVMLIVLCACAIAMLRIQVPIASLQTSPIPAPCHRLTASHDTCEWNEEFTSPYADVKALDEVMAMEEVTGAR